MVKSKKLVDNHWIHARWRPMMGWIYMIICIADFIIFPILWSILQAKYLGKVDEQWDPLTLKGAGLFHLAMGAIMGVAAWSRGQEKITAMNLNTLTTTNQNTEYINETTKQQPINESATPRFSPPKPSRGPAQDHMSPLD